MKLLIKLIVLYIIAGSILSLSFHKCKSKEGFKLDISKANMGLEEVKYESDSTTYIMNGDTFYNYSTGDTLPEWKSNEHPFTTDQLDSMSEYYSPGDLIIDTLSYPTWDVRKVPIGTENNATGADTMWLDYDTIIPNSLKFEQGVGMSKDALTGSDNIDFGRSKQIPSVQWTLPDTITYGDQLPLKATANVKGKFEMNPTGEYSAAFGHKFLNAGDYVISLKFTPTNKKYKPVFKEKKLHVKKATYYASSGVPSPAGTYVVGSPNILTHPFTDSPPKTVYKWQFLLQISVITSLIFLIILDRIYQIKPVEYEDD